MHFLTKNKSHQYLVFSSREIALFITFSCPDEKIPTLNGASVLLEGDQLSAYAADGKSKSVRGVATLPKNPDFTWERHTWLVPRSSLIMASNVVEDGQEAYFPLHGNRCALNGFERWRIETTGEDVKLDWHEFDQPVPANTQMGLPFEAIDKDVAGSDAPQVAVDVRYSSASLKALTKLALAGLTPNLTLDIHSNGLLHAVTDGGTQWHAVIKPVSLEAQEEEKEEADDSIDEKGELQLSNPEPKKRGKRVSYVQTDADREFNAREEARQKKPPKSSKVTPIGKARGKRGRK